jgi:carboxyl-terminal processing protease
MENWQKAAIAAMLAVVLALGAFGFGMMVGGAFEDEGSGPDVIADAYDKIIQNSENPPDEEALTRGAIRGMVRALQANDPYAVFYGPGDDTALREVVEGRFSGVGVRLSFIDNKLEVVSVLPDSPALEAGIRRGDIIASVGKKKVTPKNAGTVVDRIKGEEGTKVHIVIRRGDRRIDFTLERRSLDYPSVSARLTDAGHAYVRILSFVKGTSDDVASSIERLRRRGADGVVLDLRDNGGGLLLEAVFTGSLFLQEGDDILIRRTNDGGERSIGVICEEVPCEEYADVPLVVLVNGASASASEILAGALQDHERADLVGTRTFGKAKVQDEVELDDGSSVKLTTESYLTPDGRYIDGKGITPDIIIEEPRAQLERAERLLDDELASVGAQG